MDKNTSTLYLKHVRGSRVGEVGEFDQGNIRIGRGRSNDLSFDTSTDKGVSSRHAMISPKDGSFVIEDLKSLNGTYVNGFRISEPVALSDGDEIEFAPGGPILVVSLTPPRGTQEIPGAQLRQTQKITKSPTLMISDAFRTAQRDGGWRVGNATSVFIRQLVSEAAQHSSKRLRRTLFGLMAVFILTVGALTSSLFLQQEKISELIDDAEEIRAARAQVHAEREALRNESLALQAEINRQAVELERLQELVQTLGKGGISSRVTESGSVSMNLPNVLFEYDAAALAVDGFDKVKFIASVLRSLAQERSIRIDGHASFETGGDEEYNIKLSLQRAESVAEALIAEGLSSKNIETRGFGSGRPMASNDTDIGRRRNRRVEVIIQSLEQNETPFSSERKLETLERPLTQKLI